MPSKLPPYVKMTTAKGRSYYYFKTGVRNARGQEILAPLPGLRDPGFGSAYGSFMAGRTRRANVAHQLGIRVLVGRWIDSPEWDQLAAGTRKTYQVYANVIADRLHPAPAAEVTRADVVALRAAVMTEAREKGLRGTGAANGLRRTVQALYKWARNAELVSVDVDPAKRITNYDSQDHEPWPDDLLAAALIDKDPGIRLPVALLYYTALRIGDGCALRWDAIRLDPAIGRRVIDVRPQKGRRRGQELIIPIHRNLEAEFGKVRSKGMTILADDKGRPISPDDVLRPKLQAWAAERGHKVVPHGLRKNAINALLENGCSVAQAAAISGQSLQLVEHYAKRRNTLKLGDAAILNWEGSKS